jgi:hypothetical protein
MKHRILIAAGAGALLLGMGVAGQQAMAHHAFAAEYDGDADVLLKGKVTSVEWINPHAWVHMDVTSASGVSTKAPPRPTGQWMVEGGTPNTLLRSGITRDSIKAGTDIVVRGYWAKDKRCAPACKANGRDVTFPDGRKVFMGSSGTGAPKDGSDASEAPK